MALTYTIEEQGWGEVCRLALKSKITWTLKRRRKRRGYIINSQYQITLKDFSGNAVKIQLKPLFVDVFDFH